MKTDDLIAALAADTRPGPSVPQRLARALPGALLLAVAALATPSLATCLTSIPVLAVPLLGALLWALSAGAPRRPALAGALVGLAAGGLSAALYALFCTQDAALFVLPAYTTAILIVPLAGTLLGARTLAW